MSDRDADGPGGRARGCVYLVGAGPGDPGLLTVRGRELLERCDVVVCDHLADKSLLDLVPEGAERIYMGKSGAHSGAAERQEQIHALLVERAQRGLQVVRLKGGDPFVFGRGGEEAQVLAAAGVRFEVVPGVSSAIAAAAYAGIPVTHRVHNTSVAFLTGHEDPNGAEGRTDWTALSAIAAAGGTLVILMGIKHLARNMDFLVDHGVPAETPAAVVQWGTRPDQRTVVATVGSMAAAVAGAGLGPPAVTVVGRVVELRQELAWFERRPLAGLRVLVTRGEQQSDAMIGALRELGALPVVLPTIEIAPPLDAGPLEAAVDSLSAWDGLLLTSANAVEAFFGALTASGLDSRALAGVELGVVGTATAAALAKHGVRPDVVPPENVSDALAEALVAGGVSGRRFLLPQAAQGRPTLARALREAGATVDVVTAYRTIAPTHPNPDLLRRLKAGELDVLTFASPSALRNLAGMLGEEELRRVADAAVVVCIGPVTAQAAHTLGVRVDVVPGDFTVDAMLDALVAHVAGRRG